VRFEDRRGPWPDASLQNNNEKGKNSLLPGKKTNSKEEDSFQNPTYSNKGGRLDSRRKCRREQTLRRNYGPVNTLPLRGKCGSGYFSFE